MKLYLDENIPAVIAKIFSEKGYDVISASEIKAIGFPDYKQLELAIQDKRAIVTYDIKDFMLLAKEYFIKGKAHYGIILVNNKTVPSSDLKLLISSLEKLLEYAKKEKDFLLNKTIFLTKS